MMKNIDVTKRASDEDYVFALFDITGFLCGELVDILEEEDEERFKRDRWELFQINSALEKMAPSSFWCVEIESSEKIFNLLQGVIMREYKRLKARKLYSSEACIMLVRGILEILKILPLEGKYLEIFKIVKGNINSLWKKIGSKVKKDQMYRLKSVIKECICRRALSKYNTHWITLETIENQNEVYEGESDIMTSGEEITLWSN